MSPDTEWVVYCESHRHYLTHASAAGTTWTGRQDDARRYPTKPKAARAAKAATWLDHAPIVWALPTR